MTMRACRLRTLYYHRDQKPSHLSPKCVAGHHVLLKKGLIEYIDAWYWRVTEKGLQVLGKAMAEHKRHGTLEACLLYRRRRSEGDA